MAGTANRKTVGEAPSAHFFQRGAFYELMAIFLLPVYTYTGYYIGARYGYPWVGGITGFFLSIPVISVMFSVDYLGTGVLAIVGLGGSIFLPESWRLPALLGLCVLPLIRRLWELAGRGKDPPSGNQE